MKKQYILFSILPFMLYIYGAITENDLIGDLFAPIILLILIVPMYLCFKKQPTFLYKVLWLLLFLSCLNWLLLEALWGFYDFVLYMDPKSNPYILYGYSLSNLFIALSLLISAIMEISRLNKLNLFLDSLMVFLSLGILIWVFVFDQDTSLAALIVSDKATFPIIILNFFILSWTLIWFFSNKTYKLPVFYSLAAIGGLLFVFADFSYYYAYYYTAYDPNSWIDTIYLLSFFFFSLSSLFIIAHPENAPVFVLKHSHVKWLNKELLFIISPLLIFLFKQNDFPYLLALIASLLFYYFLVTFIQKNNLQEEVLTLEKNHVAELEKKVEERTKEIRHILNTDYITGLYSRRYFEEKLADASSRIKDPIKLVLLYIDLNKYNAIKSLYGNDFAEKLLKMVGLRLQQVVTLSGGLLASYGEDVFLSYLISPNALEEGIHMAEDILSRCSSDYILEGHSIRVTLNIGLSCFPTDSENPEILIKNGYAAMNQARSHGFNRFAIYNDQIGSLIYNRHRLELRMKQIEYESEFLLFYQPQISSRDGRFCGMEALLRWFIEQKEFISPIDFIPIAEENGIIVPLGYWVIEMASKQYVLWRQKYPDVSFKMAVNVSAKQLLENDFVENLRTILQKYDVDPKYFEIEITENQQLENNAFILETLQSIQSFGISIAIDDFGTGYSSLYYLKKMPVDRIKLAKELVDSIDTDIYSKSIIQMILNVAKENHYKVIAEGVETKLQWDILNKMGCDELQGYYFSRPLPPKELENKFFTGN